MVIESTAQIIPYSRHAVLVEDSSRIVSVFESNCDIYGRAHRNFMHVI